MSRSPWCRLLLATMACTGAPLVAQEDRPRLILHTHGATAAIRSLEFSRDSGRLFVAGEDKVVHVYVLQQEENGPPRATLSRTLRWEFGRGLRGAIYDLAVSHTGDDVAIGGHGARDVGGGIAVLDSGDGTVQRFMPDWNGIRFTETGHRSSIVSLDYSPGGRLVSSGKDGRILLWSAAARPTSTLVRATRAGTVADEETYLPVLFLDEATIVAVEGVPGTDDWQPVAYDVARAVGRSRTFDGHRGRITALALAPEGNRWASADQRGNVFVWSRERPGPLDEELAAGIGAAATDLSFGPRGRLAAAVVADDGTGTVEYWNVDERRMVQRLTTGHTKVAGHCVVSPDGRLLAAHSSDDHRVFVYRLDDGDAPLTAPFSQPPTILAGQGRAIRHVAFAADGSRRLAYGTVRPTGPDAGIPLQSVFDLKEGLHLDTLPEDVAWRRPTDGARGWSATLVDGRERVELRFEGRRRGWIQLNRGRQGLGTTYCFVHDAEGRPFAIAVGTDEQHGIFVYALPDGDEEAPLLRYFRDHNGAVRSLSVSPDGRLLASGSEDQLIKVWSLAGLQSKSETFRHVAGWGASFAIRAGSLVVEGVDPAGIAAARNLRNGDVLVSVTTKDEGLPARTVETPAAMHEALDALPLYASAFVGAARGGVLLEPVTITPAWEPLATLYVDRRGEWALFTPRGDYDSSVAEGNELFGWQVNRGPTTTPRIFAAGELQERFENPEVIRKLLSEGRPDGEPGTDSLAEVMRRVPELQLVQPRTSTVAAVGREVRVVADVRLPGGLPAGRFAVRAYVNGIPLGEPVVTPDGRVDQYEWRTIPPDPICNFRVLVEDVEGGPNGLVKWDEVAIFSRTPPPKLRLHLLAMAVDDYADAGAFSPLKYAKKDVEAVVEKLRAAEGEFYDVSRVEARFDGEVTRASAKALIDDTRKRLANADQRDLLVVYLAGHGFAHGAEYYFVPGSCATSSRDVLDRDAIPWHELQRLESLPCRKVLVLDTCFAGNVALNLEENAAARRTLAKAASTPFARHGFLVVMATDANQMANEGVNYDNHGAFTHALLRGLDGEADRLASGDRDGIVSLYELVEFSKSSVFSLTERTQRPVYMPLDRFRAIDPLKLVRRTD